MVEVGFGESYFMTAIARKDLAFIVAPTHDEREPLCLFRLKPRRDMIQRRPGITVITDIHKQSN
jgi:hypothetical protein